LQQAENGTGGSRALKFRWSAWDSGFLFLGCRKCGATSVEQQQKDFQCGATCKERVWSNSRHKLNITFPNNPRGVTHMNVIYSEQGLPASARIRTESLTSSCKHLVVGVVA